MYGSTNWRNPVQSSLGRKQNPISKITKTKRAIRVTEVVEHLPSKGKALSSNLSTRKKRGLKLDPTMVLRGGILGK
jgi:hypothetical protein